MAYTALYREWRPKDFNDVVGQEHITTTLKNAIKTDRIAHAYLLCGTRGTGKTSTAKILSKAVNCLDLQDGEPCNQCEMCKKINSGTAIDVTELDAASHNSVDNIRDIIEDVQYPPQEAKFKVFIIDEVHMLSVGAVNAFLKTLEEPPSKVIFILATTDPQKLPITILSRCQRFDFKRIKGEDIFGRLRTIVSDLGVYADDKSLKLISRICDGAMRDALSVLDQVISMSGGKVEYDNLIQMLGLMTNEGLIKVMDSIIAKDTERAIRSINDIVYSGKDINIFIKDLTAHMRNLLMAKVSDNPEEVLDMSSENIELLKEQAKQVRVEELMRYINILQEAEENAKFTKQGRIYLELAIIKMCKIEYDTSIETILGRINKLEESIRSGAIAVTVSEASEIKNSIKEVKKAYTVPERKVEESSSEVREFQENSECSLTTEEVRKSFKDIQGLLKARKNMVLATALMMGEVVSCDNGVITIGFEKDYSFHKNRLEKDESRKVMDNIFSEVLKQRVKVIYTMEGEYKVAEKSKEEILLETFPSELIEVLDE
ncbi:DNA polymerase III subunit gamma/tau [Clostridium sp. UBA4548]|uniref:DNA polymerase III subunit gamma/tau n=1 Tax=Clostridium sp. UBA4548 TaxID=1946361 RepID=UPI0025BFB6C5|nr:DNA polymerase III subunit gamma/tau [Clostridium sp. UBA4548]